MYFDVRFVEAKVAREAAAQRERSFVRRPNLDPPVVVNLHRASVRLDIAVKSQRRAKGVLENPRGFLEAGFEIAVGPFAVRLHIGQLRVPFRRIFIARGIIVQHRRARTNRFDAGR